MAELKKIPLSELKTGMTVARADRAGIYFPFYGTPIKDEKPITTLRRAGVEFVFIKEEKKNSESSLSEGDKLIEQELIERTQDMDKAEFISVEDTSPTIEEVKRAALIHRRAKEVAKGILTDVRMGKSIDTNATKDVVNELVISCMNSPAVFASMTRLKDYDDYTFTHSLNVSIISIAIGRRLGKSEKDLSLLGLAGIMHDVGKMLIPDRILNKPGKLTDDEFKIIQQHPEKGYERLKKDTKFPEDVSIATLQHHEKSDGSGYPCGLMERQINPVAKIVSIADVYDAVTSDRVYHKGVSPSEALKLIFENAGKHFNETLVKFFINIMGIYPVGTLLILDTQELAIVFETSQKDIMRPTVLMITDEAGKPVVPYLFDLRQNSIKTGKPLKKIISSIRSEKYGITTNEIINDFVSGNPKAVKVG
ncbi:HD-GYP domain-containing protein [Limisalsivibrio acetivorans]|uniref:HD-GYP domain-containing protein n=1 Tax=Limisalsivibrio acetivorans TaxID=1304888 RepID=UPI0003B3B5CF|nr:HD-GYP domain-containing protein [Limisalsivibrio acetivorans]